MSMQKSGDRRSDPRSLGRVGDAGLSLLPFGTQPGYTSNTVAEPMPPPAHMLARPMPPPRRRSSNIVVMIMRAPVHATGWPSEQPEPLTLVMSSERPSSRQAATGTDANASLI